MDKLVLILFEASIALILFYLMYYFVLRKETFFKTNRLYLLFSVLLSLLIPWLNFNLAESSGESILVRNVLETITITSNYEMSIIESLTAMQWFGVIYLLGALGFLCLFLLRILKITRIDKQAATVLKQEYPKNVRFVKADITPFSFMSKIYVNPNKYDKKQLIEIIAHEQVHIKEQHSYDCLFYELLIVFFWFNPIVYKYRKSAKEIHEYLADKGAIQSGISNVEYQKLLFEQATGQVLTLANSFNYSLTKNRLLMLTKIKSTPKAKIRVLFSLPIIVVLIITFACKEENNEAVKVEIEEAHLLDGNNETNTKTQKAAEDLIVVEESTGETNNKKNGDCYFTAEKMPEYPGGELELRMFIAKNIKYPAKAVEKGISGKVYVSFVVNTDGNVQDVQIARGVHELLDTEAIRIVSAMPPWTPGEDQGKKVKVAFTIPINFQLN